MNEPVAGSRILGTHRCVRLVLLALRLNLPQALPATMAGVSRPPASRVVLARTLVIAQALQANVPVVEDLDPTARLVVDGMLLPCWSWKDRPDLYPGRHKATGLDIQVACTLTGRLTRVLDPLPGRVHDTAAIRASGLLDVPDHDLPPGARAPRHIADRGGLPGVSRTALKDRLQGCPRHVRQPNHQRPAAVGDFRPPYHLRTGARHHAHSSWPSPRHLPPGTTNKVTGLAGSGGRRASTSTELRRVNVPFSHPSGGRGQKDGRKVR